MNLVPNTPKGYLWHHFTCVVWDTKVAFRTTPVRFSHNRVPQALSFRGSGTTVNHGTEGLVSFYITLTDEAWLRSPPGAPIDGCIEVDTALELAVAVFTSGTAFAWLERRVGTEGYRALHFAAVQALREDRVRKCSIEACHQKSEKDLPRVHGYLLAVLIQFDDV